MLKAGECICRKCARKSEELFYFLDGDNLGVYLRKGKELELYDPDGSLEGVITELSLTPQANRFRGRIPNTLKIDYVKNGQVNSDATFYRGCPECYAKGEQVKIIGMGDLPTYVIGIVGKRTAGKSSWIHSVQANVAKILEMGYPYYLSNETEREMQDNQKEATKVGQFGETGRMFISSAKKKGIDKEVATVFLVDLAGEYFSKDSGNERAFRQSSEYILLGGNEVFPGVDAVIFMDDAEDSGAGSVPVINAVRELNILRDRPVAYVLNKIDTRFNNKDIKFEEGSVSLASVDTFQKTNSHDLTREELKKRLALETHMVKMYRGDMVKRIFLENSDSAGFVIKSCRPYTKKNADGVEIPMADYEDSINVLDPMIWILNRLGIFPLGE